MGWRHRAYLPGPGLVTGELGIRMNSDTIKPTPANAILVVGDSFTAGSEVEEHETYSAQVEQRLGYPVINGGVGGFGADQMILAAKFFIPIFKPAFLVVGILDDDINRVAYKAYGGTPKPWFEVIGGELRHHDPVMTTRDWKVKPHWSSYSYLAVWLAERFGYHDLLRSEPNLYPVANNDPPLVTCLLLRDLAAFTREQRVQTMVVMLYGGHDQFAEAQQNGRPIAVANCAREAGLETLDLWSALLSVAKNEPKTYHGLYSHIGPRQEYFGHFTKAGNGFVAQRIAQRMQSLGWGAPASLQGASVQAPKGDARDP
jgi:hypothetical protein